MPRQDPDHRCYGCDRRCGSAAYCSECLAKDPEHQKYLAELGALDDKDFEAEKKYRDQKALSPWKCIRCDAAVSDPEYLLCDPCVFRTSAPSQQK